MYFRAAHLCGALGVALLAGLAACGGGGSNANSGGGTSQPQTGSVALSLSDASNEDWATIGVTVLSIALTPQGGGNPVTLYTQSPAPMVNLEQLDQLSEVLGNIKNIPVGTYTGATITLSANPGDVSLMASPDPEFGFAEAPNALIPSNRIQIQGAQGAAGSKTVPITVTFDSPLVVTAGGSNALDLEFDLNHPAFLVGHVPPAAGTTIWAVNFNGPLHQRHIADLTHLVLRHTYGTVASIATDNLSMTITKDLPAMPVQTPETAVATNLSLTVDVDATNGTLYYDVDAGGPPVKITDFKSENPSLVGKFVRVAARYQQDGSLVATRIWASTSFAKVWVSPEGHVLKVVQATAQNPNATLVVTSETGKPVPLTVNASTEFLFHGNQIGTGPAFLSAGSGTNVVRGFKVHASVTDPLAAQFTADTIDIETAGYDGKISNANATSFTYTRKFLTPAGNYSVTLDYIDATTANGTDFNGNKINGFKYWEFAYPTLVTSCVNTGTGCASNENGVQTTIQDFVSATTTAVNFGGTIGPVVAQGLSFATWGDMANVNGWSAPWAVLMPVTLPLGTVASALTNPGKNNYQFMMSVPGGTLTPTIDISATPGSATLVYQVDRTPAAQSAADTVSVSPEDITTSAGLNALTAALGTVGTPVRVYGVPQSDGTLRAYAIVYFTGAVKPAS